MVTSAPSLSHATLVILHRLMPLGFRMTTNFIEIGDEDEEEDREVSPNEDGWEAKVDTWANVFFCIYNKGPSIQVALTKTSAKTIRVGLMISGNALNSAFVDHRKHDKVFYVPLFQIALGLGVGAGVGDLELEEFEPTTEKQVEEAIWHSPRTPKNPSRLGLLRRVPGAPKPKGDFVVTERPEGFWLLEHPSFLKFLATQ
jgi:hypothetical protein